jgi:hypothetical protein
MSRKATPTVVAVIAAGCGIERWGRRTHATRAEKTTRVPGDDIVARPMWQATRSVTINAPPADVWPWLVQMGYPTQRAGWYTPYWMDRLPFGIHARSERAIVPELQRVAVGDRVLDSETGKSFFEVTILEPRRPHRRMSLPRW